MLNFCLSSTGHVSFLDKTFVFNCFFFKNSEFKMNSIVLFDELINFYKKKRESEFLFTLARTIHYLSFPHHLIDSLEAKPVDIYSLRELDISISQHMLKSLVL